MQPDVVDPAAGALADARRSVGLLESLLEALADGVFALDRRGRVIHWSDAMARLTGVEIAAALGRPAVELLGPLARRIVPADGEIDVGWLEPPGAEKVPVRLTLVRSAGPGGTLSGVACAVRDLRAEWAEQVGRKREAALADLGRGLASAVHQLRNPLGAACGFAELLERDLAGAPAGALVPQLRRCLSDIERRIQEVLAYARPRPLDLAPLDLAGLLARVAEQVRARFPGGPAIELDAPRGRVVAGDEDLLRQAFENLLVNGCEAAGDAGRVRVLLQPAAGGVRVLIRNTGEAVAPEHLREIFAPFRSGKSGGTGLGLPLARRVIDGHGGRITPLSGGGWTTFVVTLVDDPLRALEGVRSEEANEQKRSVDETAGAGCRTAVGG